MTWWLAVPEQATGKFWAVEIVRNVTPREWPAALAYVPEAATGKFWAVVIVQHVAPRDWPAALERVPEALRPAAEQFLRETAQRMRVARQAGNEQLQRAGDGD